MRLTLYGVEGSTDLTLAGGGPLAAAGRRTARRSSGLKFTGTAAVLAGRLLGTLSRRS